MSRQCSRIAGLWAYTVRWESTVDVRRGSITTGASRQQITPYARCPESGSFRSASGSVNPRTPGRVSNHSHELKRATRLPYRHRVLDWRGHRKTSTRHTRTIPQKPRAPGGIGQNPSGFPMMRRDSLPFGSPHSRAFWLSRLSTSLEPSSEECPHPRATAAPLSREERAPLSARLDASS